MFTPLLMIAEIPWWVGIMAFAAMLVSLLLVVVMLGLFLNIAYRRCTPENRGSRRWRWWPILLIPPLLLLLLISTARVERTTVAPHHEVIRHVERANRAVARQNAEIARRTAEMHSQIAQMDIHELMDRADAPRIALAPEPPAPPAPPAVQDETEERDDNEHVSANEAQDASDGAATEDVIPAADAQETSNDSETTETSAASTAASAEPAEPAIEAEQASEVKEESSPQEPSSARPVESETSKSGALQPPSWVHEPPKRVGQVWREVIETDEYATVPESYRAADILLQLATYDHLARLVGLRNYADGSRPESASQHHSDGRVEALRSMGIGIDYIRREIAKDEYVETVERSFGPMKKLYTLVEFSPAVDRELRLAWEASQRQERVATVGVGAGSILGLLALAWGLLKIDTATRGYYSKRLFLGVPAALIAGFGLLVVLMEILDG